MSGFSRSRGSFCWWLRQEDLRDRLSTDVAGACRQIPDSTAVLTVRGELGQGGCGGVGVGVWWWWGGPCRPVHYCGPDHGNDGWRG